MFTLPYLDQREKPNSHYVLCIGQYDMTGFYFTNILIT